MIDAWTGGWPPWLSRVSVRIALPVALTTLVGGLLWPSAPWWQALGIAVGLGGLTYGVAHAYVHERLRRAQTTLRRICQHEFDDLRTASSPRGDELSALIWEVYRTGRTLEEEIQELKQMENYRREFIGNVSHELKTPIFSVQGFTETLLDGAIDDDAVNRTFLKKIMANVNRLDSLARDLSDIARIETGELEMSATAFDVGAVAHEVVESLEFKAHDKGITLRQRVPDTLPPVHGDRERIRQVLVNLADNAIKYNERDGQVDIVAREQPNGNVKVAVVDDGIGVDADKIERLTERFYRVDKSRSRNQGGTGLGLAIVKHILGAHDRTLHIESTPGQGSTFGFTLPTASSASPVEA